MYELTTHNDLISDVNRLMAINPKVVYRLRELILQLQADDDLLDRLLQNGYGGTLRRPARHAVFNVKVWVGAQNCDLNLWRLRDFSLAKAGFEYRIIYAVFPKAEQIIVLALVEKEFDYDLAHPISRRIISSYRGLTENLS